MKTLRQTGSEALRMLRWPIDQARRGALRSFDTLEIFLGGFGLVVALVAAALLSPALGALPGAAGDFAPIGMAVILAPVGVTVALGRRSDVERFFRSISERTDAIAVPGPRQPATLPAIIVDTSAIIDGRLTDLVESGFLLAHLVIPRFILDELRYVADSSDPLKRQRGRRGMESLVTIQAADNIETTIDEAPFAEAGDVDARLIAFARDRGAALLTTDYNLARIAELESLRVLNLNALAQAIRTVVLPGEPLQLTIQQEGRERHQGVGYLQDGTMVVVEEARSLVGEGLTVNVVRVIQTSAGRMVFAEIPTAPSAEQPTTPDPSATAEDPPLSGTPPARVGQ